MTGINKVILVGNVGVTPEIRTMQDGREMAKFSLATTDSWKDKETGERKDRTEWHRITVFSQGLVKIVKEYIQKGSKLYIEGSLQTRTYELEDGIKRYTTEVTLQGFSANLTMLDKRPQEEEQYKPKGLPAFGNISDTQSSNNDSGLEKKSTLMEELDDEVPF